MIEVPPALIANLVRFSGDRGREWAAGLPRFAEDFCPRWALAAVGVPMHGYVGLMVPVLTADSSEILRRYDLAVEVLGAGPRSRRRHHLPLTPPALSFRPDHGYGRYFAACRRP
jgi:hypothetical protein